MTSPEEKKNYNGQNKVFGKFIVKKQTDRKAGKANEERKKGKCK